MPRARRGQAWLDQALPAARRLLGNLDREAPSLTRGSFDREHWSWKFRDFPIGTMQMGVYPLTLLWRHPFADSPYHQNSNLLRWIEGALDQIVRRQKRNGAFEAFAPNDFDPGPTLGIVYAMARTAGLAGDAIEPTLRQRVAAAAARGADFALRHEQSHGYVSNHWALFACAFHAAAALCEKEVYAGRARQVVREIIRRQSAEGWYPEYGGPDPGYESLGIAYLASFWKETRDPALLESLRKSAAFFTHCVHPDGSSGGVYGSRQTHLFFPSGFEMLATVSSDAAAVVRFMSRRVARGNVVTPLESDAHNLAPLLASYLDAALAAGYAGSDVEPALLPCEGGTKSGLHVFPESGLATCLTDSCYGVFNARKGGVGRVFSRAGDGNQIWQDAGYVAQTQGAQWASQRAIVGRVVSSGEGVLELETGFAHYSQPVPTPSNYLVLRILALTVFRSARVGTWIRDRIVRHLLANSRSGPLELRRRVTVADASIAIDDEISISGSARVASLRRLTTFTAIHMGSARTFHANELDLPPDVTLETEARTLDAARRVRISQVIRVLALSVLVGCASPVVTIDTSERMQVMAGWEALVGPPNRECDYPSWLAARERILDVAANDLGINRVRLPLRAGMERNDDTYPGHLRGEVSFDDWKRTWHRAENDNDDPFVAEPRGFQWESLDSTITHTVLPLRDRLRARGDDLWINAILPSAGPARIYQSSEGEEYAEFIVQAFEHLRTRWGITPNSLEIVNEPKPREWTAAQLASALLAVRSRLAARGFSPRFLLPSATTINGSEEYLLQLLRFPGVAGAMTDVSYHRYGGGEPAVRRLRRMADSLGYGMAMTEQLDADTRVLREDLEVGRVSAWQQFGLAFCPPADSIKTAGIYITFRENGDSAAATVKLTANARFLRHYFRMVKLGAIRVGAASSSGTLHANAFVNPDGGMVVVLESSRPVRAQLDGLGPGRWRGWWTSADSEGEVEASGVGSGGRLAVELKKPGALTLYSF
ncbi:MAG: hypothetical protein ACT4OZ_02400 [Gemmatimonadota bacterium]